VVELNDSSYVRTICVPFDVVAADWNTGAVRSTTAVDVFGIEVVFIEIASFP
jgi:hypothetical protein